MVTQRHINDLSYEIVACAIEVHSHLGPGLLESVYQTCLVRELKLKGMRIEQQVWIPVQYKGKEVHCDLRLDILVEDLVIVELKSVEYVLPVFRAQLMTYMKLLKKPKGLLINFNVENITKHLVPIVNEHFAALPK